MDSQAQPGRMAGRGAEAGEQGAMTSQAIADAALVADRARRAAERRGDAATAAAYDREARALLARLNA